MNGLPSEACMTQFSIVKVSSKVFVIKSRIRAFFIPVMVTSLKVTALTKEWSESVPSSFLANSVTPSIPTMLSPALASIVAPLPLIVTAGALIVDVKV